MFGERAEIRVELVHFLLVCERGLLAHAFRIALLPALEEGELGLGLALVEGLQAGLVALLLLPAAAAAASPSHLESCQGLSNEFIKI